MRSSSRTDIGGRAHHEDALFVDEQLGLFAVFDGHGAHAPSIVAS